MVFSANCLCSGNKQRVDRFVIDKFLMVKLLCMHTNTAKESESKSEILEWESESKSKSERVRVRMWR